MLHLAAFFEKKKAMTFLMGDTSTEDQTEGIGFFQVKITARKSYLTEPAKALFMLKEQDTTSRAIPGVK